MNTQSSIVTSGEAASENTTLGKAVFSRVAEPRVKIPLLVFMNELKIDLTLKKSNFLFLLCFEIAKLKFIPMRQSPS